MSVAALKRVGCAALAFAAQSTTAFVSSPASRGIMRSSGPAQVHLLLRRKRGMGDSGLLFVYFSCLMLGAESEQERILGL